MFGGGGGNVDPRQLQQMMQQMGIDVTEIEAEEIVIRTAEEELVFENTEVQRMDAQGEGIYTINGDPERRPRGETELDDSSAEDEEPIALGDAETDSAIPDADVEIVAQRTGSSESEARTALEATNGDLADAVSRLE